MRERQEIEQYFFDKPTLGHLADFASRFDNPCCLCTPSLGAELEKRGVRVTTLDIDERFSMLRGFRLYDINKPEPPGEKFGVIICDPPFLNVTLAELFEAIKVLSLNDYSQRVIINCLSSRALAITRLFSPFGLETTGYKPSYSTIQNIGRNKMEFFGNLDAAHPLRLPVPTIGW